MLKLIGMLALLASPSQNSMNSKIVIHAKPMAQKAPVELNPPPDSPTKVCEDFAQKVSSDTEKFSCVQVMPGHGRPDISAIGVVSSKNSFFFILILNHNHWFLADMFLPPTE